MLLILQGTASVITSSAFFHRTFHYENIVRVCEYNCSFFLCDTGVGASGVHMVPKPWDLHWSRHLGHFRGIGRPKKRHRTYAWGVIINSYQQRPKKYTFGMHGEVESVKPWFLTGSRWWLIPMMMKKKAKHLDRYIERRCPHVATQPLYR